MSTIATAVNGRIMKLKKVAGQGFETGLVGIESNFYSFGMTTGFLANLLVRRIFQVAACEADSGGDDARLLSEEVFFTPKTTGGESR